MPAHGSNDSKGFTLIEVMISLVIVSTSLVFILNALAKVAEAQKEVEVRGAAYSFLASKMAELEQRVQPQGKLKESVKGHFRTKDGRYDWELSTGAAGGEPSPETAGAAEAASQYLLLTQDLKVLWKRGAEDTAMRLSTLSITHPPRSES